MDADDESDDHKLAKACLFQREDEVKALLRAGVTPNPRISNLRVAKSTAGGRRALGLVLSDQDKCETYAGARE